MASYIVLLFSAYEFVIEAALAGSQKFDDAWMSVFYPFFYLIYFTILQDKQGLELLCYLLLFLPNSVPLQFFS